MMSPTQGTKNEQIRRDRKCNRSCQSSGEEGREAGSFNKDRVSVCNDGKNREKDSGDCKTMSLYVIPLNYMLKMRNVRLCISEFYW